MAKINNENKSIKSLVDQYVKLWENRCYRKGIPDECHEDIEKNNLAPSYRQIVLCILKNDFEVLGFQPKRSLYYSDLKKIELAERGVSIQLRLF
jgi:predicted phosphoadenosine phosphosulfate sulfurtransferase